MKKTIKILFFGIIAFNVKSADLIVQENGPTGTYNSIQSAIDAANNGDRVLVHNKVSANAWVEDLTIGKTIEIASAEDTVRFRLNGDVIIDYNGQKITIIAADLLAGSIERGVGASNTTVEILGSKLRQGKIDLDYGGLAEVHLVSNYIQGYVYVSKGDIIGNEIKNLYIYYGSAIDTINIIGNQINGAISCNSASFTLVKNNFIKSFYGIEYDYANSGLKVIIENNTVMVSKSVSTATVYYLRIRSKAIVKNNIFIELPTSDPTLVKSPKFSVSYLYSNNLGSNYHYLTSSITSFSDTLLNTAVINSLPANLTDGRLTSSSPAIDGADPSFEYYDLDLTRGDAGCYGGSYTLDNYFPMTGSSRVYGIDMPFAVSSSSSNLKIKAGSFDR